MASIGTIRAEIWRNLWLYLVAIVERVEIGNWEVWELGMRQSVT
ncbi:hypothetical protein Hanom_Chr00s000001g01592171 [Helianthus anomalus]